MCRTWLFSLFYSFKFTIKCTYVHTVNSKWWTKEIIQWTLLHLPRGDRREDPSHHMHMYMLTWSRLGNWIDYNYLFLINVCLNKLRKNIKCFPFTTGDASTVFPGKVIYCLLLNYSCQFFLITIIQLSWHFEHKLTHKKAKWQNPAVLVEYLQDTKSTTFGILIMHWWIQVGVLWFIFLQSALLLGILNNKHSMKPQLPIKLWFHK